MARTKTPTASSQASDRSHQQTGAAATEKKPNAVWTSADDATLVDILEREANDVKNKGDNGFKSGAWKAAAAALFPPLSGGTKTPDGCRDHWGKVVSAPLLYY